MAKLTLNDMVTDIRITVIKRFVKKLITELENNGLGEHICIKYISEFSKIFIQEEQELNNPRYWSLSEKKI